MKHAAPVFIIVAALSQTLLGPTTAIAQTTPLAPAAAPNPQATTASGFDPAVAKPPAGPVTIVMVPGGTPVSISLAQSISSNTVKTGDTVPIVVANEVDVNGMMIAAKNAGGQATITQAQGAGGNGSGGKIALNVDFIYSVDGGKIALASTNHQSEGGDQKGASSTATIATYLLLGPLGFFAHNFVHGKDVTIDTTRIFKMFVDHDIHVSSSQMATNTPGFDH